MSIDSYWARSLFVIRGVLIMVKTPLYQSVDICMPFEYWGTSSVCRLSLYLIHFLVKWCSRGNGNCSTDWKETVYSSGRIRFSKNQKHLVKRLSRKGSQPPNINGHNTRMKGEWACSIVQIQGITKGRKLHYYWNISRDKINLAKIGTSRLRDQ